ncbi:MAG: phosphatase PAP2 family protein [Patescibacteria group bacterium]
MSESFFSLINGLANKSIALDYLGIFFASWAIILLVVWYLAAIWHGHPKHRVSNFVMVFLTLGLVYAINFIIGYIWFEPRPFVSHKVNLLINIPLSAKSFPSDHAALAFVLAVGLWQLNRKWLLAFIIASIIALARVYVGVHYFSDVVVGALIGGVIAWFVFKYYRYWFRIK